MSSKGGKGQSSFFTPASWETTVVVVLNEVVLEKIMSINVVVCPVVDTINLLTVVVSIIVVDIAWITFLSVVVVADVAVASPD